MRSRVPNYLMTAAMICFAPTLSAANHTWDQSAPSNCAKGANASLSETQICTKAREGFSNFKTSDAKITDPQEADTLVRGLDQTYSDAKKCCNTGSGTDLETNCVLELGGPVKAARERLADSAKAGPKNDGAHGAAGQTTAAAADLATVNSAIGGACLARKSTCELKYQDAKKQLDGCADCKVQSDTLEQRRAECHNMNATEIKQQLDALNQVTPQSTEAAKKTTADDHSNSPKGSNPEDSAGPSDDHTSDSAASGDPSAVMPMLMQLAQALTQPDPAPPAEPAIPAASCTSESIAGCMKPAEGPKSWNPAKGEIGNKENNTNKGQFDVGAPPKVPKMTDVTPTPTQVPANSSGGVPNGGGPMAGGGGGAAQASLGGSGGGAMGGGAGSSGKGDILHGDQGRSAFSGTNAAMTLTPGGTGGYSGYPHDNNDMNGLQLASFLPGGKNDPNAGRRPAGMNPQSAQINDKQVNIWNRISEHIRSRCSQGLLRDCIP